MQNADDTGLTTREQNQIRRLMMRSIARFLVVEGMVLSELGVASVGWILSVGSLLSFINVWT
jgi:hypothetical protein